MNIFKLSGGCNLPVNRTNNLVTNYLGARKNHFRVLLVQYGSVVFFKTAVTAALLFLGSVLVIRNQITIGQFVAAEIVVILIMNSVEKLILGMDNIYDVLTALEKIGFVTDLPLENDKGLSFEEVCTDGGIDIGLEELTFKYKDANRPTLNKVSMNIKAGERICIAGYNGSGKSTLLQLMEGMYTDFDGMITYNGVPIKDMDLESLRKHIGSLSTQDKLFNSTVLENINLGSTHVPLKSIIEVSKNIGLHEYINRLPNGYQTELLADGINVPGSVRTKIILARTLIANPALVVLENFMPSLERKEKQQIIDFLTSTEKKWTLVAISNNPHFAIKCDRVIILKDGEVKIDGNFKELKNNPYIQEVFRLKQEEASI